MSASEHDTTPSDNRSPATPLASALSTETHHPATSAPAYYAPKKVRTNWWLIGAMILAVGALAWLVWQRTTADKQTSGQSQGGKHGGGDNAGGKGGGKGAVAVGVAPVVQQDIPVQLTALGTATSSNTAIVRPQTTGTLQKIFFKEGDNVRQGQLLAQLDNRSLQAATLQAEGQLQKDTALLENAKLDLQRYALLKSQNSIATQQVDTQASLVKQYLGTVKIDQANLAVSQVNLSYSHVTAPISGRIGLLQTTLGNLVSAGDANGIATITQLNPITVVFGIPENQMGKLSNAQQLQDGLAVEAWNKDYTKKLADGKLLAVDSQINSTTGTLNLKAIFANTNHALFPNQFVNIKLDLGKISNAVAVPNAAIQVGKVGSFVYVVDDSNTVKVTPVTVGTASETTTQIMQGLTAGQKVVVDGLDKLRDGSTIVPIDRNQQGKDSDKAPGQGGHHGHRHGAGGTNTAAVSATSAMAGTPAVATTSVTNTTAASTTAAVTKP